MLKQCIGILISLFSLVDYTQSQSSFEFCIDSEEDCIVWEAAKDNYDNTILVGLIGPNNVLDLDGYVLKINPDGSYLDKRFDFTDTLSVFSTIEVLETGNYFIIGSYSLEMNFYERDYLWVVILDQNLNLLNQKSYKIRESYSGFISSICSVVDNQGNIVITTGAIAEESVEKTSFTDFAFYKFSPLGDTLISKYYLFIADQYTYELRKMPGSDNLMLIENTSDGYGYGELMFLNLNLEILKTNSLGYQYGILSGDFSSDYWLTDTSFLFSSRKTLDMGTYSEHLFAVYLIDTTGVYHNELMFDKPDTADYPAWRNSMAFANDSTIYIGGFQIDNALWETNPTIVELYMIDKNMNLLGYKELGGDANYEVWGIIATDDKGCLLYGTSFTNDSVTERDIYIWKVLRDDINLVTTIETVELEDISVNAWPNPCQSELNIGIESWNRQGQIRLQIFNLAGKKMTDRIIEGEGNLLRVNVTNLKTGAYIYQVYLPDGNTIYGKFIKQ
jgi:hypothetical protein